MEDPDILLRQSIRDDKFAKISIEDDPMVPLNTGWTFWIDKAERGTSVEEFEANLRNVYTVETVQQFWSVFNHIPSVANLKCNYSYHLMRMDRKPLWEDELNRKGGAWRVKIHHKDVEMVWKELLLAAIGEQFVDHLDKGDDICGVTVTVREKDDLVQIWNSDSSLAPLSTIPAKLKSLLPSVTFLADFYKAHYTHHAFSERKK